MIIYFHFCCFWDSSEGFVQRIRAKSLQSTVTKVQRITIHLNPSFLYYYLPTDGATISRPSMEIVRIMFLDCIKTRLWLLKYGIYLIFSAPGKCISPPLECFSIVIIAASQVSFWHHKVQTAIVIIPSMRGQWVNINIRITEQLLFI